MNNETVTAMKESDRLERSQSEDMLHSKSTFISECKANLMSEIQFVLHCFSGIRNTDSPPSRIRYTQANSPSVELHVVQRLRANYIRPTRRNYQQNRNRDAKYHCRQQLLQIIADNPISK